MGIARTPAVIAGSGLSALGVMRSLGRAGIPFYNLNAQRDYVASSRWHRPAPWGMLDDAQPLADYLEQLPLDRAVLFTTNDDRVREASTLDATLTARFPASIASAETIDTLLDKLAFARVLAEQAIPHPRTFESKDLDNVPDDVFAHSFLKPRHSLAFNRHYKTKGLRIASRDEARERLRQLRADGFDVILQEYIPGDASAHYFVDGFIDRHGIACGRFARQRIRMYPPHFGNSSSMISVDPKTVEAAVQNVDRLLAHLRYRGIFSAELKLDPRDGLFKLLEVNCRPWWFNGFAADCGVDVTLMAYDDALGREVGRVAAYAHDVKLVSTFNDLRACRPHLLRAAKFWLGARDAMFSRDDPMPFFHHAAEQLQRLLRRRRDGGRPAAPGRDA